MLHWMAGASAREADEFFLVDPEDRATWRSGRVMPRFELAIGGSAA